MTDAPTPGTVPCRFCLAVWLGSTKGRVAATAEDCRFEHRDEQRVYDLARVFARVFQGKEPTDEQVGWFLADADQVVDDFQPAPERWKVRRLKLPRRYEGHGVEAWMRINGVLYLWFEGSRDVRGQLMPEARYRQQLEEADRGRP